MNSEDRATCKDETNLTPYLHKQFIAREKENSELFVSRSQLYTVNSFNPSKHRSHS